MGIPDKLAGLVLIVGEYIASKLSKKRVQDYRGKTGKTFKHKPPLSEKQLLEAKKNRITDRSETPPFALLSDKVFEGPSISDEELYQKLSKHVKEYTQDGTEPMHKGFEKLLEKAIGDILTADVPRYLFDLESEVVGSAGEKGVDVLFFIEDERAPIRGIIIAQAKWQDDCENGLNPKNHDTSGLLKLKNIAEKFHTGNYSDIPNENVKKYGEKYYQLREKYERKLEAMADEDDEITLPLEPKIYLVCASPKFTDTDEITWEESKALKLNFSDLLYIQENDLDEYQLPIPKEKVVFLQGLRTFEVGKNEKRTDYLCTISGFNLCTGLYDRNGDKLRKEHGLLYTNVRDRLTSSDEEKGMPGDIRRSVKKTIKEQPEDFFSKNNGITLIVKKLEMSTDSKMKMNTYTRLTQPQLVNGGQTLNTLWDFYSSGKDEDLDSLYNVTVPLKIVEINSNDAEYNRLSTEVAISSNHQNSVEQRDLEALTPLMRGRHKSVQKWSKQKHDTETPLPVYFATKNGEWANLPDEKRADYIRTISASELELFLDSYTIGQVMWSVAGGGQLSSNNKKNIWEDSNLKNALFKSDEVPEFENKRLLIEKDKVWRLKGENKLFLREAIFCKYVFTELLKDKKMFMTRTTSHYTLFNKKKNKIQKDSKLNEELKIELNKKIDLCFSPYFMSLILNQALRIRIGGEGSSRVKMIDYFVGDITDSDSTRSKKRQQRTFGATGDIKYVSTHDPTILCEVSNDPHLFNNRNLTAKYSSTNSEGVAWSFAYLLDICHRAIYTATIDWPLTGKRADKENKDLIAKIIQTLEDDIFLKFLSMGNELKSQQIKEWESDLNRAFVLLDLREN